MKFPIPKAPFILYCTNCNPKREYRSLDGFKSHMTGYHRAKPTDSIEWVQKENSIDVTVGQPAENAGTASSDPPGGGEPVVPVSQD